MKLTAPDVVRLIEVQSKEASTSATQFIAGFVAYAGINGTLFVGLKESLTPNSPLARYAVMLCLLGVGTSMINLLAWIGMFRITKAHKQNLERLNAVCSCEGVPALVSPSPLLPFYVAFCITLFTSMLLVAWIFVLLQPGSAWAQIKDFIVSNVISIVQIILSIVSLWLAVKGFQLAFRHFSAKQAQSFMERFSSPQLLATRNAVDPFLVELRKLPYEQAVERCQPICRRTSDHIMQYTQLHSLAMFFSEVGLWMQNTNVMLSDDLIIFDRLMPAYWRELAPFVAACHLEEGSRFDKTKKPEDQPADLVFFANFYRGVLKLRQLGKAKEPPPISTTSE